MPDPEPIGLPTLLLQRRLGAITLPTELVVRHRAVDREQVGGQAVDTTRHLDALESAVRREGIRVPLVLALNDQQSFLDGNHRLAVAIRLELDEVPVEVWTAPQGLRTDYGRAVIPDDLRLILDRLGLASLPL